MSDEGWSEPWPRVEGDLGVWDRFVEQLDVAELQREHMRVLGPLERERFGSRHHNRTMAEHEQRITELREGRAEPEGSELLRAAVTESRELARRYRIDQARKGHAA